MSKAKDKMRPEYRREGLGKGARGKYYRRFMRGTNLVLLDDEVAKAFSTPEAVNEALHGLITLAKHTSRRTPRATGSYRKS